MDFYKSYRPLIEAALGKLAPGEKIGWTLSAAAGQGPDGVQIRAVQLTFWTPSPVLGDVITASTVLTDPFTALNNLEELLRVQIVEPMQKVASELLSSSPNPSPDAQVHELMKIDRQTRD